MINTYYFQVTLHLNWKLLTHNLCNQFQILSKSNIGATASDNDDIQSQGSAHDSMVKEDCYQIVGTLKNENSSKPDWVHSIIDVSGFKWSYWLIVFYKSF